MSNRIKIILMIAVLLLGAMGVWLWSWGRPGVAMHRIFPAGAVAFGRLSHAEAHANAMLASDLFKNLASIDALKVLARNNVLPERISEVNHWQKNLLAFWANPIIKNILGQEAAIAVYPSQGHYEILMAVRLDTTARFTEMIGQLSQRWGQGVVLTNEKYNGHRIKHVLIKDKDIRLMYVRLGDVLVISSETSRLIKTVVDTYTDKKSSLGMDPLYVWVQEHAYVSGDGLVFINIPDLALGFQNYLKSWKMLSERQDWGAVSSLGFSFQAGTVNKLKLIVGMNVDKMRPETRRALACAPSVNDSLSLVVPNVMAYHWGSCYDFKEHWLSLREHLNANPDLAAGVRQFKQGLEKRLTLSIERDVLPVLGNEVGGYLTEIDTGGLFPFPRMLFFIKIHDQASAQLLLDKITAKPISVLQEEVYNQAKVRYISLPFGANMDPGYCFLGDYLLVATSRQLLKRSIDAYQNPQRSMVVDKAVKQFGFSKKYKANSVTLVNIGELALRMQDLVDWMNKYLTSQINLGVEFQQEGKIKDMAITEAMAEKEQELMMAQKKLEELKSKPTAASLDDPMVDLGPIQNLRREVETLRNEIVTYKAEHQDLLEALVHDEAKSHAAKLTIFNTENVMAPLLKGLSSFGTQGATVRVERGAVEMELLLK